MTDALDDLPPILQEWVADLVRQMKAAGWAGEEYALSIREEGDETFVDVEWERVDDELQEAPDLEVAAGVPLEVHTLEEESSSRPRASSSEAQLEEGS